MLGWGDAHSWVNFRAQGTEAQGTDTPAREHERPRQRGGPSLEGYACGDDEDELHDVRPAAREARAVLVG